MAGQKDGHTLFISTILATAGAQQVPLQQTDI